ncbi:MAG: branched-chain amino acid ABC transporter permease [Candidatus Thorarchaeota archaeon]
MKNLSKTRITEFIEEEFWLLLGLCILFGFFLVIPFIMNPSQPAIGLQIVLNGIVVSVLYAILAMGFSLIYGIAKQLKLSLGAYYVVAAYTMYFLLEAVKITPGSFPLLKISTNKINVDGVILWVLVILPILLIIGILIFMWTVFEKREFLLMVVSVLASGGGFLFIQVFLEGKVLEKNLVEGLYISLAVILLGLAAWYLELPKREIAIGVAFLGVSIPILMYIVYLNVIYISLMIIAVMLTACFAMISDRYLLDKVRKSHVNVMIVTFAVALFVQNFIQIVYFPFKGKKLVPFGPEDRTLHGIVPLNEILVFFGARISYLRIISVVFSIIALILLYAFIWFTRTGMALRAVAQDEEAAALAGIDIRKITAIVSGVGMGLIGFAAVLTSSFSASPQWSPYMGWWVLITCIAVVTLGGMGSLPGSIIAAFIIGYAETISGSITTIIPIIDVPFNSLSPVIPFAAILLVLIFKPEGILGTKEELE